jgi:hypothetical protein
MALKDATLDIFPGTARTRISGVRGLASIEFDHLRFRKRNILYIETIPQVLHQEEAFGGTEVE